MKSRLPIDVCQLRLSNTNPIDGFGLSLFLFDYLLGISHGFLHALFWGHGFDWLDDAALGLDWTNDAW